MAGVSSTGWEVIVTFNSLLSLSLHPSTQRFRKMESSSQAVVLSRRKQREVNHLTLCRLKFLKRTYPTVGDSFFFDELLESD